MEDSEQLRETLVSMRREMDILRTETTHANLLITALDAVLCVEGDNDPFAGVFSALKPVFAYAHAVVLIERDDTDSELECVASSDASAVGSIWKSGRLIEKALAGRIVTTVSQTGLESWPDNLGFELVGKETALYLPLGVRGRRGLMMLIRNCGESGFDREHVTLARKFSLLASHGLAAKRASQTEAESHRLKKLTAQLRASQDELRFRANHDQLTGLPNRAYMQEIVTQRIAAKKPDTFLAFAFADVDDFKRVNDHHGHPMGDALLKEVASRIQEEIRATDVVGRLSGDEFVIVIDPVENRSQASAIISRIRARLKQPFVIDGTELRISGSIGVAFNPTHGSDYETLRRHADLAMYRAKTASKGGITVYSRNLGREATEKMLLERKLRDAITAREFRCALQQKVDIHDGKIVGFEALVRWVDADGRIHAPGVFLPLAGELGLLDSIAHLLVDDLLRELPRLDARFGTDVRYSINVSAEQSAKLPFMQKLIQRLGDTGRGEYFTLELTEESLAATGPFQAHILPLIREAGIGISIDDFGTGYSSLAKLAELTVDELKVDRSLVMSIHQRPRSQDIFRAIESLASALGISVVAEGIETPEESAYLIQNTRLRIGQGYLFHKPQLLSQLLESADRMPQPDQSSVRLSA